MALRRRLRSSAFWNVAINGLAAVMAGMAGIILLTRAANDDAPWWGAGIGQSLIAASGVGLFAFLSALFTYLMSHRPYEAMFDAGVLRVFPRGNPGQRWREQLKKFNTDIIFYGKDHNHLFSEENAPLVKMKLLDGKSIGFYLLSLKNSYYNSASPKERSERIAAAKALFALKEDLAGKPGNPADKLYMYEYDDYPAFSCRLIDQAVIVFGPYLPGVPNEHILEFEIERGGEMFEACQNALNHATSESKRRPLERPEDEPQPAGVQAQVRAAQK